MHGLIVTALERFATEAGGPGAWPDVLAAAGLPDAVFVRDENYPDEQVTAIVGAAAEALGLPADALLERFGRYLAPALLASHAELVPATWRTLDLLANTEHTIHATVRVRDPGAAPPRLRTVRTTPNEVRITYASRRGLCAVARGIVGGIAEHYGEQVSLAEPRCLHRGDAACEIVVRLGGQGTGTGPSSREEQPPKTEVTMPATVPTAC